MRGADRLQLRPGAAEGQAALPISILYDLTRRWGEVGTGTRYHEEHEAHEAGKRI